MLTNPIDQYGAGASSLGYEYQVRLALLMALESELDDFVYIETADDIEIITEDSRKLLSLKHKKVGNHITDLSIDFWKSVNIWLKRYKENSNSNYFLITTEDISIDSFLIAFSHLNKKNIDETLIKEIEEKLRSSKNDIMISIIKKLKDFLPSEKLDFFSKITIFHKNLRITDIPKKIKNTYLTAAHIYRIDEIYERFEGWWYNKIIDCMSNNWIENISKKEIILKINEINEEYHSDSLPLIYADIEIPESDIEKYIDESFLFVKKINDINLKKRQINKCIIDFYKATNERNNWIKKTLVRADEITKFENLLIDEWERFKDSICDEDEEIPHDQKIEFGKKIFNWSQERNFTIRSRVTNMYISRGTFHIIADDTKDRLYWLPKQ